jgi:hypothetical protein
MQIGPSQVMVMLGGEWAVRLPRAPPHGIPAPLLADEARSTPDSKAFDLH